MKLDRKLLRIHVTCTSKTIFSYLFLFVILDDEVSNDVVVASTFAAAAEIAFS